jgi:uncharacterized protein Yka (UPF0111/DUF47 family)
MTKQLLKAEKLVNVAVSTFSKAIEEVEKANALLESSILADGQRVEAIYSSIKSLTQQADQLNADSLNKQGRIKGNNELIEKLKQFTN